MSDVFKGFALNIDVSDMQSVTSGRTTYLYIADALACLEEKWDLVQSELSKLSKDELTWL